MKRLHSILWLLLLLLPASCSKDAAPAKTATFKPLSQRLEQSNGYKQDASGSWIPKADQRSSFESQGASPYFKEKYGKKSYSTAGYQKKSWWGDKDYGRKSYSGNTDGSRFQTTSLLNGRGAGETGKTANLPGPYKTGTWTTGSARETAIQPITKPTDAATENLRKSYPQPDIIDWKEQRSLSLDQSKGILGR